MALMDALIADFSIDIDEDTFRSRMRPLRVAHKRSVVPPSRLLSPRLFRCLLSWVSCTLYSPFSAGLVFLEMLSWITVRAIHINKRAESFARGG